jgi:hypothetical protein
MSLTRILLLAALGMLAGCGGCDSCLLSKPSAEDDAATGESAARPLAVADASPAKPVEALEAGADAAPPVEAPVVPRASSLPRPKAPMPLGAFQSCGRYDGPICEKSCPNGNCRQECDGVECRLTCEKGYCSQMCGASARCSMTCAGGHCVQACTKPEGCTKECAGGGCEQRSPE